MAKIALRTARASNETGSFGIELCCCVLDLHFMYKKKEKHTLWLLFGKLAALLMLSYQHAHVAL